MGKTSSFQCEKSMGSLHAEDARNSKSTLSGSCSPDGLSGTFFFFFIRQGFSEQCNFHFFFSFFDLKNEIGRMNSDM